MSVFSTTWKRGKIEDINELTKNDELAFTYILDTNIVIYIRDYYEDKLKFMNNNKKIYEEFKDTIHFLKNTNSLIVYQFACDECCKDKKTGITNVEKYKYMVHCLNKVLNKNFSDEYLLDVVNLEKIDKSRISILKSSSTSREIRVITYPLLLKALILKKYYEHLNNEEKIIQFIKFMDEEVNISSPMYILFAIYYFGNYSTILKNININKDLDYIMDKVLAAAIDLSLPTISAQLVEIFDYELVPIFVTFDKGIKDIFDSLYIKDLVLFNDKMLPAYQFDISKNVTWDRKQLKRILNLALDVADKRKEKFNNNDKLSSDFQSYIEITKKVESQLKACHEKF